MASLFSIPAGYKFVISVKRKLDWSSNLGTWSQPATIFGSGGMIVAAGGATPPGGDKWGPSNIFGDENQDLDQLKQQISKESGLIDPNAESEEEEEEDLEGYSVDEDGVEWFEDEDGYWWYRSEGQEDWQAYEE